MKYYALSEEPKWQQDPLPLFMCEPVGRTHRILVVIDVSAPFPNSVMKVLGYTQSEISTDFVLILGGEGSRDDRHGLYRWHKWEGMRGHDRYVPRLGRHQPLRGRSCREGLLFAGE